MTVETGKGVSSDPLGDLRLHFVGVGEAAEGFLREDQLTVEGDFEHTVAAFDQCGSNSETLCDRVRQTGGTGLVVSNDAVLDLHVSHGLDLQWEWGACPVSRDACLGQACPL